MVALLVALPTVNILQESLAAAATPTLVRSAASQGSGGVGTTVNITASFGGGTTCNTGDTLIAMVTIAQQNGAGGMVSATPAGWQRLFEHSPVDTSPYQGWFVLSGCSGVSSATFSISAPGNSAGPSGSVVLNEFSGLPNPVAQDFSLNDGSSSSVTSDSNISGPSAVPGELVLSALSFYGGSPSQTTPSGWNLAGTETTTLPAYTYYQVGGSSAPIASYSWSPASSFEVSMLALKAGPSNAPNVVQESQGAFSGTSGSVTLPNGVGAGDALVAEIGTDASGATGSVFEALGLSGGGVIWHPVSNAGYRQSGNGSAEVWVGLSSTGTSGATSVIASLTSSVDVQMVVSEVSGIASVDAGSSNHGSSSNPSATSITPQNGDFLVDMLETGSSVVTHPQPNWSTFSLSAPSYAADWQSNAPNSSSTPSWNTSSSGSFVAVQAAFVAGTAAPVVSGVSPSSGSSAGGTSVSITGANFAGATAVRFNGTAAGFAVNSSTSITATTPAGSVGTVNVTVTTPAGTSATSGADDYTYTASSGTGPGGGGGGSGGGGPTTGYWMVGRDGGVFAFGNAGFVGSLPGIGVHVNNIVAVVPTPSGQGYWMVGSDGGVFAFGNAGFVGSLPGIGVHVNDIVAVVPTSTGRGYWMVGSDGGVFAFGDAGFVGSLPGIGVHVNNIVAVVPTATGRGYWMVGKDGGVFAFGNAGFVGSLPGMGVHVNNVVGVVSTSTGRGYWMVGSDGGVFAFGDAGFVGSVPSLGVHVSDVVGVVATSTGKGYWMVGSDGGVFAFGDAGFVGSLPGINVHVSNIVAVVPT